MGHPKITIRSGDYPAWGKLVKTWATGRNYVNYEATEDYPVPTAEEMPPRFPKPRSFGEFWDQCRAAHVVLVFDDGGYTEVPRDAGIGLVVLQSDSDVFTLKLPADKTLREGEARYLAGPAYALPQYYKDLYGHDPDPAKMNTKLKRMELHAERVGEYTLNTCG